MNFSINTTTVICGEDELLDKRADSVAAFDRFVQSADKHISSNSVHPVPIAVTCGAPGAGKTTQLMQIAKHFEVTTAAVGGKALFVPVVGHGKNENGKASNSQRERPSIGARLIHRLLQAAVIARGGRGGTQQFLTIPSIRSELQAGGEHKEDFLWMNDLASNPSTLLQLLRSALGMKPCAPLLVLVDDIQELDSGNQESSGDALCLLGGLSQGSFEVASGEGVMYVVAALCSLDLLAQIRREVHILPLTPISLKPFTKWLYQQEEDHSGPKEKQHGRTLLWACQWSPQRVRQIYTKLVGEKDKWSLEFFKMAMAAEEVAIATNVNGAESIRRSRVLPPTAILSCLFWPVEQPTSSRNRTLQQHKLRIAEDTTRTNVAYMFASSGACSIIPNTASRHASVFMHPAAVKTLCQSLCGRNASWMCTKDQHLVQHVLKLADLLFKTPKAPHTPGNLYKQIVRQLFVCRLISATRHKVRLSELLPHFDPAAKGLFNRMVFLPHTNIPEVEQQEVAAEEEEVEEGDPPLTEVPPADGDGSLKGNCIAVNKLTIPTNLDGCWYTCGPLATALAVDTLMVLKLVGGEFCGKRKVCLCLRVEVEADADKAVRSFRKARLHHCEDGVDDHASSTTLAKFAAEHHLVYVLVAPNAPMKLMQQDRKKATWKRVSHCQPTTAAAAAAAATVRCLPEGVEAYLTDGNIREFCPMVAYSGCDARVALKAPTKEKEQRKTKKNDDAKKVKEEDDKECSS